MIKTIKNFVCEGIIVAIIVGVILDYKNIPSSLGFEISNMNWSFCTVIVTILLYVITYKAINKRTIERDKNKDEISIMLLKKCYSECKEYIVILNKETYINYIIILKFTYLDFMYFS